MLEKLIKGIKNISLKTVPYVVYTVASLPFVAGLGGGCDNPKQPKAPIIDTDYIADVIEGQSYSDLLTATDKQGDDFTFSKKSGPSYMTVHGNGSITCDKVPHNAYVAPGDEELEVICTDNNSNASEKKFNFSVINTPITETVSIGDIYQYGFVPVEGVDVDINGHLGTTNASGIAVIDVTEEGNYTMTIDKPGYHTYTSNVNVLANSPNILEHIVLDNAILDEHYYDICLIQSGKLQKADFKKCKNFIYTADCPGDDNRNWVINFYEITIPELTDNRLVMTIANGRLENSSVHPGYDFNNSNQFGDQWNTSSGHSESLQNPSDPNLITGGTASFAYDATTGQLIEESLQKFGLRNDSAVPELQTTTLFESGAGNGVNVLSIEDKKIILRWARRPIDSTNN